MRIFLRHTANLSWAIIAAMAFWLDLPMQGSQELTNVSQVRDLTAAEAAKGVPVNIRGTITLYKRDWNCLFIQKGTAAAFVKLNSTINGENTNLQEGQVVEVIGKTVAGPIHCDIAATAMQVVGAAPLPDPLDLSETNFLRAENERLRVKAKGQIFNTSESGGHPRLQVATSSGLIINVDCQSGSMAEIQNLRGSLIEFEGVLALELSSQRRHTGRYNILVPSVDGIRKIRSVPIVPVSGLATDGQLARIRAIVEEQKPDGLLARDSSGLVNVQCGEQGSFLRGSAIEIVGYPAHESNRLVMKRATVAAPTSGDPALAVINKIAQIRDLSATEAARGYPVQVRGIVTYNQPGLSLQFMQDATAGIYVSLEAKRFDAFPTAGTRIEVLGFTGPGNFAPIIVAEEIRVLGDGNYPSTTPVPFQLMMTGGEDSQWIELNGVIRSATTSNNQTIASLSTGDAIIQMTVLDSAHPAPTNLVGASISARGVCRTLFDDYRHFQAVGFCVPGWDQFQIQEEQVADPFQLSVRPINGLFEFHAGGYGLNRAHVRGRITMRQPNGGFFVQDDTGGIHVRGDGTIPPEDWVEVVGFPAMKDQLPVLQDALVIPAAQNSSAVIPPLHLTPETVLDKGLNATLVTLEGRVVAHSSRVSEESVTVQFGPWFTDAVMEKSGHAQLPRPLPGSVVAITGVFAPRLDNNRQIQSFQILLRSPADVAVISTPPWWTARHALFVFGGLAGVLLLSLAWAGALRRQVRLRTAELSAEIEERKRVEAVVKKAQRDLMAVSRQAGMAEVATSVLHNVGNVLNSVNISGSVVAETIKQSKVAKLNMAVALLTEHADNLGDFLTNDPKGRQLPAYFAQLAEHLATEQKEMLRELKLLGGNIEHIKGIVAMQQNYARTSNLRETLSVTDLVEEALRLVAGSLSRHHIQVQRDYQSLPPVEVEKHKLLQILVNLIQNAKNALLEGGLPDKQLTLRVGLADSGLMRISVIDNGMGIAPENLTCIFAHGFTTRKDGHGFGLHSGALAARELGGSLTACSAGPGKGATFVLEFPANFVAHLQAVG